MNDTAPLAAEIESALLAAILTDHRCYDRVADSLKPEHFCYSAYGRIYTACGKLIEAGTAATPLAVADYLSADEELARQGGAKKILFDLAASVVTTVNVGHYAERIRDFHSRRELVAIAEELRVEALTNDPEASAEAIRERAEEKLYRIASDATDDRGPQPLRNALDSALNQTDAARKARERGEVYGVPTGILAVDRVTGGLYPGDLIILAGRPGMGKSVFGGNVLRNAALAGHVGAMFSLEMSAEQLAQRLIAAETGVSADRQRRGDVTDAELEMLVRARSDLFRLPIHIDDTAALSMAQIRSRARRLKRSRGLALVVIDYLQLVQPADTRVNRVEQVSRITRDMKGLAKDLAVPVLALCQLSRRVEERESKRPVLADLRESGAIEQDADSVGFLFREEYYLEKEKPVQKSNESDSAFSSRMMEWGDRKQDAAGKAEFIIAKNRHGPPEDVLIQFDAAGSRFVDWGEAERLI